MSITAKGGGKRFSARTPDRALYAGLLPAHFTVIS